MLSAVELDSFTHRFDKGYCQHTFPPSWPTADHME